MECKGWYYYITMERFKQFYAALPDKRKILFWIAVGCFALAFLRLALWAAAPRGKPKAKAIIHQMKSDNAEERQQAFYIAGITGLTQAIPLIEQAMKSDPEHSVKRVAACSLGRLDKAKLISYLDGTDAAMKELSMESLLTLDRKNISILMEKFPSQDVQTKIKTLELLAAERNPDYVEPVLQRVETKDEKPEVRKACLSFLMAFATRDIESRLLNVSYNDEDPEIKTLAAYTVKYITARVAAEAKTAAEVRKP